MAALNADAGEFFHHFVVVLDATQRADTDPIQSRFSIGFPMYECRPDSVVLK